MPTGFIRGNPRTWLCKISPSHAAILSEPGSSVNNTMESLENPNLGNSIMHFLSG